MFIRILVSNIIHVLLALHNLLSSRNGVVEPSALGMAAKITEFGNSSINGWNHQN